MKLRYPLLLGLPAAFATGWFLRPLGSEPSSGTGPSLSTGNAASNTAASLGGLGATAKKPISPLDGPPPIVIKPLTSLKEILAMLGPDGGIDDEATAGIMMMELMPRLMITDTGAVQAMLEELSGTEGLGRDARKMLTMGLMFRWMTVQPETAIGYSLAHPAMLEDSKEMNMLGLVYMAKARPEAAKGLAALMPEDDQKEVKMFLAKLEATSDPGGVLRDPAKQEGMDEDDRGQLAARWLRSDPAAAMAWLQALPEDQRSPEITSRMAAARMQQDPAAALAWINTLPDGPEKTASRDRMVQGAMEGVKDLAALEAKLATLPSAWHDGARLQWLSRNTAGDPAAARDQLESMVARNPALANDRAGKQAITNVSASFANRGDFAGGTTWAMSLPPGESQAAAAAAVTRPWSAKDPEAASTWITGLPEGQTRDAAATSLISQIQREDPASALVWAESLSNANTRREQTRGVFQSWFKAQPMEALNSIQKMPPEEQQRIFTK